MIRPIVKHNNSKQTEEELHLACSVEAWRKWKKRNIRWNTWVKK